MAKYNINSGKPWAESEINKIKQLAKQNTPTGVMSIKIGRTPNAIRTVASKNDISLKPVNRSPYNRRKK